MSEKIVQLNEEVIKGQLKELVRGSVEETLNELLENENEQRQGCRSGRYSRNLTTTSGDICLRLRVHGGFRDLSTPPCFDLIASE